MSSRQPGIYPLPYFSSISNCLWDHLPARPEAHGSDMLIHPLSEGLDVQFGFPCRREDEIYIAGSGSNRQPTVVHAYSPFIRGARRSVRFPLQTRGRNIHRWVGIEPRTHCRAQHWLVNQCQGHTPSIVFRHLPTNSARFGYATDGALFISAQLSTDAVSALRKV